jgi:hypothetical protein
MYFSLYSASIALITDRTVVPSSSDTCTYARNSRWSAKARRCLPYTLLRTLRHSSGMVFTASYSALSHPSAIKRLVCHDVHLPSFTTCVRQCTCTSAR